MMSNTVSAADTCLPSHIDKLDRVILSLLDQQISERETSLSLSPDDDKLAAELTVLLRLRERFIAGGK